MTVGRLDRAHFALRLGLSIVVVAASGCAVARATGGEFAAGAVARLDRSDSTVIELQRRLSDTASVLLRAEFEEAVLRPAKTTWSEMRLGVREEGDSLTRRVEELLREATEQSLPAALDRSGLLLVERIGTLGQVFGERLSEALAVGMSASIQPTLEETMAGVIRAAALGLDTDLRPVIHGLMLEVRDSLELRIGDVDRAVAGSQTVGQLRYALYGAGLVALLAASFGGVGVWRRKGRALDALIDAIEHGGDEKTKQAVSSCAQEKGIHSWLGERIRDRTSARGSGSPTIVEPEP